MSWTQIKSSCHGDQMFTSWHVLNVESPTSIVQQRFFFLCLTDLNEVKDQTTFESSQIGRWHHAASPPARWRPPAGLSKPPGSLMSLRCCRNKAAHSPHGNKTKQLTLPEALRLHGDSINGQWASTAGISSMFCALYNRVEVLNMCGSSDMKNHGRHSPSSSSHKGKTAAQELNQGWNPANRFILVLEVLRKLI